MPGRAPLSEEATTMALHQRRARPMARHLEGHASDREILGKEAVQTRRRDPESGDFSPAFSRLRNDECSINYKNLARHPEGFVRSRGISG